MKKLKTNIVSGFNYQGKFYSLLGGDCFDDEDCLSTSLRCSFWKCQYADYTNDGKVFSSKVEVSSYWTPLITGMTCDQCVSAGMYDNKKVYIIRVSGNFPLTPEKLQRQRFTGAFATIGTEGISNDMFEVRIDFRFSNLPEKRSKLQEIY